MKMLSGTAGLIMRLAVTFGLLTFLVFWVAEPAEVVRHVRSAAPIAILIAVGLSVIDRVTMAYKWWLLLRARGLAVSLWTAVRAYFASSLYGLVLPVTVGADAVRIVALRHVGIPEITASIVVERGLGVLAMVSVALLSCLLLSDFLTDERVRPLRLWLLVVIVMSVTVFTASFLIADRAARWDRAPAVVRRAGEAYGVYRRHPGVLTLFYGLSVFESLICAGIAWVAAAGLGSPLSLSTAVATVPISLAVARLPISLGGFGVQEAAFVFFGGLVGISETEAISIFLLTDIAMFAALLPALLDGRILALRRRAVEDSLV